MLGVCWAAAAVMLAGCTTTFAKEAVQPNPLRHPSETLRDSAPIAIVTGDMDLEEPDPAVGTYRTSPAHYHHFPLVNVASFTVVSRDRLRFHVQIDHKWDDYADLRTWQVELIDDRGRTWQPEEVEHVRRHVITHMWDREQLTAICDAHGRDGAGDCNETIATDEMSAWRNPMTLGTLSVYRGTADFVFYQRDLFRPDVRSLTLVVKRSGEVFRFTWRFEDPIATR